MASAAAGTDAQFDVAWNGSVVITTGTAYTGTVPAAASTSGTAAALTAQVDGKAVSTNAVLADGNYYVSASFLNTLGVALSA